MPKLDLTDRFCATIKTQRIEDYFDAKTTGLGLRVSPSGGPHRSPSPALCL
jgi:hypothetical protein